jgi:multidrug efflux system outer membrane protein
MKNLILLLTILTFLATAKEDNSNSKNWWTIFGDTTLNKIVELGLSQNHSLKSVSSKTDQTIQQSKIIRSQLFPSVYANGRWNTSDMNGYSGSRDGSSTPDEMNIGSLTLDARYRLDSWGEELQQYRSAKLNGKAREADLESAKLKLAIKATSLYFDAIFTKSQVSILEKQKSTAEKLLELTDLRYKKGESTGLVLLQQKQQLAAITASIPPATLQHKNSVEYLSAITLIPVDSLYPIILEILPTITPKEREFSIESRPDLIAASFREESAKANFSKTKMVLIPTLEVTGSAGYDYANPGTDEWEQKWAVGASVTMPIFAGGAILSGFKEGRANFEAASFTKDQVESDAKAQLANAITEESSYRTQVEAYQNQFNLSIKLYDESLREFRNGLARYLDVLAAVNSMQQTEITLLRSKRNLLNARINVIEAVGGNL